MALKRVILLAASSTLFAGQAQAQLMPGLGYPETIQTGFQQSHSFGCFLAVAGRLVPGLTRNDPSVMGDHLSIETSVPEWLSDSYRVRRGTRTVRLSTGEGDVWIVFDPRRKTCVSAAQVDDVAAARTQFARHAFERDLDGIANWERVTDRSDAGFHYEKELDGINFEARFPDQRGDNDHFLVEVTADW